MSNERLMSLIERPLPKDLVGLHMSFSVVPPLVRLRAAELLEVMKKRQKGRKQRLKCLARLRYFPNQNLTPRIPSLNKDRE